MNLEINLVCCDHHGYRFSKCLNTTALHTPISPAPIPPPPTPNQQEQITFSQACTATSCADLQEADFAIKKSQVQVTIQQFKRQLFSPALNKVFVIMGTFVVMGSALGFLPETQFLKSLFLYSETPGRKEGDYDRKAVTLDGVRLGSQGFHGQPSTSR